MKNNVSRLIKLLAHLSSIVNSWEQVGIGHFPSSIKMDVLIDYQHLTLAVELCTIVRDDL